MKLVLEQGLSQRDAASRLGISRGTLANWVVSARAGSEKAAPEARSVPESEAENARLRKELAEARLERDIVKRAAAYFARGSLPGTRGQKNIGTSLKWQWHVGCLKYRAAVFRTGVGTLLRSENKRMSD